MKNGKFSRSKGNKSDRSVDSGRGSNRSVSEHSKRRSTMEAKSFLLSALPLKIDTSVAKEGRSSKMSGLSQNTNNTQRMPVITEGYQREVKLSEALKD